MKSKSIFLAGHRGMVGPDGTYRKKMNNTQLSNIGFTPKTSLEQGLKQTYSWYLENKQKFV